MVRNYAKRIIWSLIWDLLIVLNHFDDLLFQYAARLAIQYGAAGIIVSNHGARQLDYVPATIMALEQVHLYHLLDTS